MLTLSPLPLPRPTPAASSDRTGACGRRATRLPRLLALATLAVVACLLGSSRPAWAQYKNIAFGLDAGYEIITRPDVLDGAGKVIANASNFPLRLSQGGRIGLDSSFKLHSDHWWVNFRLNFHILSVGSSNGITNAAAYDRLASSGLGTILGLQPAIGIRRYLLTDRVRPFLQGSMAYMRLISFNNPEACGSGFDASGSFDNTSNQFCDGTNQLYSYLPHQNVISLQFLPGVEFILTRDVALTLSCGLEHWFIFNAGDNNTITPTLGLTIYG